MPRAVRNVKIAIRASPAIKIGLLPKLAMIRIAKRAEIPLEAPIT